MTFVFFYRKFHLLSDERGAGFSVGRFRWSLPLVASAGRFRWSLPLVASAGRVRRRDAKRLFPRRHIHQLFQFFSLASASKSSLVGIQVFSAVSVCLRLTCPPATVASSLSWSETPDLSATSVFFNFP